MKFDSKFKSLPITNRPNNPIASFRVTILAERVLHQIEDAVGQPSVELEREHEIALEACVADVHQLFSNKRLNLHIYPNKKD